MSEFDKIQDLLRTKAELQGRLNLIPYDGSVEIKESSGKEYIYIRRRESGKRTSKYVGPYSEKLYQLLLNNAREARTIKKQLRQIEKELANLGYVSDELSPQIILNLEFARANMKSIIYNQAVLEGCSTTFPDTETILENGKVNNVNAEDVQKILNLKHAWEFVLDKDVIQSPSNYYVSQYIARLVNEGFYQDGGRIRGLPVTIGGSSYIPPLPIEFDVKEKINELINSKKDPIDITIELALYVMKTQIFNDGNKRTAIIFANHYLIAHGGGLLVVPEKLVSDFRKLLVKYYEDIDLESIKVFMKEKCWKKLN